MKPLIGINMDIAEPPEAAPEASVQIPYYEAVEKAGGIPVILPPMPEPDLEQVVSGLHGVLLIGGPDYSPDNYGEERHETCNLLHPRREEFDLRLAALAIKRLPVLGICGGCQLLNISLGGSLIQDIPSHAPDSQVVHVSRNGWKEGFSVHAVELSPGSRLAGIYRTGRLPVPTSHHQAVKALGAGLQACAFADDGIIEAIELAGAPFVLGVQWHPERDFAGNRALFVEFIAAAVKVMENREKTQCQANR